MASQIEHDLIVGLVNAWLNWRHFLDADRPRPPVLDRDLLDAQEEVYCYLHAVRPGPPSGLDTGTVLDCSAGGERFVVTADQEGGLHYHAGRTNPHGWERPLWN